MATGDEWLLDRQAAVYQNDLGSDFNYAALQRYVAQTALGWVANTNPTLAGLSKGFKPRRALCWLAADHNHRRSVVVATEAAYAALNCGTSTLQVCDPVTNLEAQFVVYSKEGERHRGIITKQPAA